MYDYSKGKNVKINYQKPLNARLSLDSFGHNDRVLSNRGYSSSFSLKGNSSRCFYSGFSALFKRIMLKITLLTFLLSFSTLKSTSLVSCSSSHTLDHLIFFCEISQFFIRKVSPISNLQLGSL